MKNGDTRKKLEFIVELCARHGWKVEKSHHYKIWPPVTGGRPVFVGCTASDHRAVKNTISKLRRAGATFV